MFGPILGDQLSTFVVGLALLLFVGSEVLWLRQRRRRSGDSFLAHRSATRLMILASWFGLACVISAFWGFLVVIALLVVAMAVAGMAVLVTLLRGV